MSAIIESPSEINDRFARSRIIFGDAFSDIQNAKILVVGLGGVGGVCVDCLHRSGVKNLTGIDCDFFEESNQNRQIFSEFLGESKALVFQKQIAGFSGIHAKITAEFLESFSLDSFDYVVDAIDDVKGKVALAKACQHRRYGSFIIATGSAKKLDPTRIKVAKLSKTYGDKLARKLRDALKKEKIGLNAKAIFSDENPRCVKKGSFSAVTAAFGLTAASQIIQDILESNTPKRSGDGQK